MKLSSPISPETYSPIGAGTTPKPALANSCIARHSWSALVTSTMRVMPSGLSSAAQNCAF